MQLGHRGVLGYLALALFIEFRSVVICIQAPRVDVEVFISVSIILHFLVPWLARHVWEVIAGAVGEALVPDLAQISDVLVDEVMVHQAGCGHDRNGHKNETDQPLAPAQSHVAG